MNPETSGKWVPCRQPECTGWAEPGYITELAGVDRTGDVVVLMQKVFCPSCGRHYMVELGTFAQEDLLAEGGAT